jgi:predicted PurR-regulated permease PerM
MQLNKKISFINKETLVGMMVYFLIIGLIFGPGFIVISIICTGGASLLFHLPASWVIGKIIFLIINFKNRKNKDQKIVYLNNNKLAIINYIRQARQMGLSDELIKSKLENEGHWAEADVVEAFKNNS